MSLPGPVHGGRSGASRSHLRPSQMPVNQSAAKITPRMYIAGSSTPEAMTSDLEHRARVQRAAAAADVRRTAASATTAMAPQTAAAVPRARVPELLGGDDREQDDDRLHGQDGDQQALHERSP